MSVSIKRSGSAIAHGTGVNKNLLPVSDSAFISSTKSFEKSGWVINLFTKTWMNEHLTVGQQYTLHYYVTCLAVPDITVARSETRQSPILVHQGTGWSQTTTCSGTKTTNMQVGERKEFATTFTFQTATETQEYYGLCMYTWLCRDANNTTYYSTFRIDDLKLEEGSVVTPYIPNINDDGFVSSYSAFNENDLLPNVSLGRDHCEAKEFYEI